MAIRDMNMGWIQKRVLILAQHFQTFVTGAGVAAGDPVMQEIGTTGMTGVQINSASDAIATVWMAPYDLDITKQVRFRVWWTKASTDADAETVTVLYSALTTGGTLISPATALSTAIPAYTFSTTSGALETTDWGTINRNTIADTCYALNLNVASTLTNASANEISLIGLEIAYTPRKMYGAERNLLGARRLLTANPLGTRRHATQEGL